MTAINFFQLGRTWLAVLAVIAATAALPVAADEIAKQNAEAAAPPPTAAQAKVRIWTAILINGETDEPLERIAVEVRCWKSGQREPQPIVFTSGSGGEVKIPLAAGTRTSVLVKSKTWWTHGSAQIGPVPQPPEESTI